MPQQVMATKNAIRHFDVKEIVVKSYSFTSTSPEARLNLARNIVFHSDGMLEVQNSPTPGELAQWMDRPQQVAVRWASSKYNLPNLNLIIDWRQSSAFLSDTWSEFSDCILSSYS